MRRKLLAISLAWACDPPAGAETSPPQATAHPPSAATPATPGAPLAAAPPAGPPAGAPPAGDDPDGDGVAGALDQCPNAPETRNGHLDGDGCPDQASPPLRYLGTIEGIEFDAGSDVITPPWYRNLDRAVLTLSFFTGTKVLVTGHSEPHEKEALELSMRRAEMVRRYLVERGIAAERITVRGMGIDDPIAKNQTRAGRAKNRRIDFRTFHY